MLRNKIQGIEATDPNFPQLSLAERRKKLRIRTYLRLEITISSTTASATIINLSMEGVRLRTSFPVEEGDRVEISFPADFESSHTKSVTCRAVWVTTLGSPGRMTYEVGLNFEDSRENMQNSWVRYVLEQLGFDENKTFQKRKYFRAQGIVPARIFTAQTAESHTAEVINLGIGGALLSSERALEPDSSIHCEICLWRILPALRLSCKVIAVREDEASDGTTPRFLHSLLFLSMDMAQVKLLGNYVIFLLNQTQE